jgi:hypothetical protein
MIAFAKVCGFYQRGEGENKEVSKWNSIVLQRKNSIS